MVTVPAPVDSAVRVPKLSALRIDKDPHDKISSYHRQKVANDLRHVLMLGVDGVIHPSHVSGGHATAERFERRADAWVLEQRLRSSDGSGIVWRKVVAVVFELHEIER